MPLVLRSTGTGCYSSCQCSCSSSSDDTPTSFSWLSHCCRSVNTIRHLLPGYRTAEGQFRRSDNIIFLVIALLQVSSEDPTISSSLSSHCCRSVPTIRQHPLPCHHTAAGQLRRSDNILFLVITLLQVSSGHPTTSSSLSSHCF